MIKIEVYGYVWSSKQNGAVLKTNGLAPCLTIGQHSGVEPKILCVYETD